MFWKKLKKSNKPILAMAPMAGITDSPFRKLCKRYGADVLYSEMASVSALTLGEREKTLKMLRFDEVERPYVVQLFGAKPEEFSEAVKIIEREIKPDGIDINFGCPVPKVCRSGAGSQLFRDMKLSRKVIEATVNASSVPVSIKTRTKVGDTEILPFLDSIKDLNVSALMIHGRTFSQGFSGCIDCGVIKKARDYFGGVILANGGIGLTPLPLAGTPPRGGRIEEKVSGTPPGGGRIKEKEVGNSLANSIISPPLGEMPDRAEGVVSVSDELDKVLADTGADGVGIGRGALGRPWVFAQISNNQHPITNKEIFEIALEHAEMMIDFYGEKTGIFEMRKHLSWYVKGFPGASEMRQKLVRVESLKDIEKILGY